jgi:limonene-1,2-epoxide hydrolase
MQRRELAGVSAALAVAALGESPAAEAATGTPGRGHIGQMLALIGEWHRKDLKAVLARVTDDIVWHTHVGTPPVRGKAAMSQTLDKLAIEMQQSRWRVFEHAERGDHLFVEGVDEFTTPAGKRVALPYAGVYRFRGTLICEWRDYFDRPLYDRMKAGEPFPDDIDALISRPAVR